VYASSQNKAASAAASFAIVVSLTAVLVFGLKVDVVARNAGALVSVLISPLPARPKPKQPQREVVKAPRAAAKGDPSPRNLKNQATPVFAPRLPPLIVPPPITAAPLPAVGTAANSGAANVAGPGQGAGGFGNGNGGGTGGDGDGGGAVVGPRQIKGKLSFKDLPDGLIPPGSEARVGVRYVVNVDGSVSNCRADEPSGIAALDSLACRLIEERFRFHPAQDRAGRPVRATIVEAHSWFIREERPRG
jgi:protein TonB